MNYDDVVEWYLRINGLLSQVITKTPCVLRDVDVAVYHPHGYLPFDDPEHGPSEDVVFDTLSYAQRAVGKNQPWRDALQIALRSKIFIGLSWTDKLLYDLMVECAETNRPDHPTAFWCLGPNAESWIKEECKRFNIVPLEFSAFEEYPGFLLRICERAMAYARA